MTPARSGSLAASLLFALAALVAIASTPIARAADVVIDASDAERFFAVFEGAARHPTVAVLQRDYLDPGSAALKSFIVVRQLTAEGIERAIDKDPSRFVDAERCASLVPAVRKRLEAALSRLVALYPAAELPPTTFLIGRGNTGGTTSRSGVLIGLETLCSVKALEPNLEDRLVHLIAHEYGHVQQPAADTLDGEPIDVLHASLLEGGAEFVAELISGSVSYPHLQRWTRGREREIEEAFVADEDKVDKSKWLWSGLGTPEKPGDLGYWVGYRIVKAYYQQARDKREALKDIFLMEDAKDFVRRSGWVPGRTDL